jgi:hypothetical protein
MLFMLKKINKSWKGKDWLECDYYEKHNISVDIRVIVPCSPHHSKERKLWQRLGRCKIIFRPIDHPFLWCTSGYQFIHPQVDPRATFCFTMYCLSDCFCYGWYGWYTAQLTLFKTMINQSIKYNKRCIVYVINLIRLNLNMRSKMEPRWSLIQFQLRKNGIHHIAH